MTQASVNGMRTLDLSGINTMPETHRTGAAFDPPLALVQARPVPSGMYRLGPGKNCVGVFADVVGWPGRISSSGPFRGLPVVNGFDAALLPKMKPVSFHVPPLYS